MSEFFFAGELLDKMTVCFSVFYTFDGGCLGRARSRTRT